MSLFGLTFNLQSNHRTLAKQAKALARNNVLNLYLEQLWECLWWIVRCKETTTISMVIILDVST